LKRRGEISLYPPGRRWGSSPLVEGAKEKGRKKREEFRFHHGTGRLGGEVISGVLSVRGEGGRSFSFPQGGRGNW